ncbi:hypothetical protein [Arachnia propionica]|uniref:hypothetical protein n=1 Tax=Arachnia propionica TaxID=1750 RepID=UPI00242AE77F|nr:hypothetical protein [Arachnia propionica]
MSSNPLTSEDLLRCRRVLDEALAADKLDSAQYRTRIRAMVVAVDKGDLYALIRDLVPAAGEPGFTDEGHEVPTVFSSVPASPVPRPEEETTRAVRATGADAYAGPAPIDSFPSFPDDDPYTDEDDPFPDENYFHLGDEDSLPGEEDPYPDEEDSFPGVEAHHLDQDVPAPVTQNSPESLEVDDPVTRVVPVIQPGTPAGPVPGELVPVRQWSAEVSPREQAPASSELSPREQAPTSTELSPVGQRSAEMAPLEPPPGTALSPAEQDDDDSVNRVVVVMVPSAPSPDEPGVIRSVWDELPSPESPLPEPEPVEPEPAAPSPADRAPVEPETEDDEPVTRISAPVGFDDSEAPTQVLDAVKDLSIFRDEATEKISEPPQPVLPYSMNQGFSSTPADPMAQATTAPSTEYAVPPMPPPVPEPSAEALASMPPPVPPSANPPQDPWAPYGQMPPPDPAAMAPPPMSDSGYGAVPSAPYYGSPQPYGQYMPPPSAPYQPPAPVYNTEPTQDQAPKRRSTWAWVVVTMMVLALLVWVAYLVIFRQGRHAAPEISSQIRASATVATSASPVTGGQ